MTGRGARRPDAFTAWHERPFAWTFGAGAASSPDSARPLTAAPPAHIGSGSFPLFFAHRSPTYTAVPNARNTAHPGSSRIHPLSK